MKIEDVIKDYPEDYNLKIGAHDGNGYFYCGTVSDWRQNCDEYSEILKQFIRSRYNKSRENCATMIRNLCKDILSDNNTSDEYTMALENRIVNISQAIKSKNNSKNRLANYIPVKDRVVMDYFDADLAVEYPECLVILIKGTESGKFWDNTEATDTHIGINTAAEGALMGMGIGV